MLKLQTLEKGVGHPSHSIPMNVDLHWKRSHLKETTASVASKSESINWIKRTLDVGKASNCTSSSQRAQENKNG